jgi:hypothetical protein
LDIKLTYEIYDVDEAPTDVQINATLWVPSLMVMVICVSPIIVMGEMVLISLRLIILKLMSSVYTLTNELSDENWSYSLLGRDKDFFDLAVSPKGVVAVTFFYQHSECRR